MSACCWLLLLAIGDAPLVDVTTLAGDTVTGRLASFDGVTLELDHDGAPVRISAGELLQLLRSNGDSSAVAPAANPAVDVSAADLIVVEMLDGSRLQVTELTLSDGVITAQHPLLGAVQLPKNGARSVRLGKDDPAVNAAWKELLQRAKKQDYLVIRKGDVLDHLDGVVGSVDDATLKFLLDGDQIDVKRPRVFGWIYAQEGPTVKPQRIRVDLATRETVFVSSISWQAGQWHLSLPGATRPNAVPDAAVSSLDFSAGKVAYLSRMEPRDVEHVPFFGPGGDWPFQRDRNLFGKPLKVGTRTYARGLALHSKTRLIYRLGGDFRRLTATVGLDPELSPSLEPAINNARLTIRADKQILFDADVKAGDPPLSLDLNVSNKIELEILVDFGETNLDIGDRVHLADLKVLK